VALTIENSGALVAGAPLNPKTRSVRVVRPFYVHGEPVPVGAVLTLPVMFATEVVANNKATFEPDAAPATAAAPSAPHTQGRKAKEAPDAGQ
jgi:hypothetical protein